MSITQFLTNFYVRTFMGRGGHKKVQSVSKPVSHDLWSELLISFVSEDGLVDYEGMGGQQPKLLEYLKLLSSAHPNDDNWTESEQLAYWINAYNAFTVQLILQHYPVGSIQDIGKVSPWKLPFIGIEGVTYSLDHIEHNILRKMNEPRIHFAIVCASISCPPLLNEAFSPIRVYEQLDERARHFINDGIRNKISAQHAELSKIFSWFQVDFTKGGSLPDFINQYAEVPLAADTPISYLEYNWGLNSKQGTG